MLLASAFVGCNELPLRDVESNQPYIHKVNEFLPLNASQSDAVYWSDGTQTDYKFKTFDEGSKVFFQATSASDVIYEEVYEVKDGQVYLCRALGEEFVEPVPLIKFPLRMGDEYEWKGNLSCTEEKHTGSATIVTSSDFIRLKDKSEEALKVDVNLRIGERAPRKLSFWFVKGKGVLKTEMGKNVREPKI